MKMRHFLVVVAVVSASAVVVVSVVVVVVVVSIVVAVVVVVVVVVLWPASAVSKDWYHQPCSTAYLCDYTDNLTDNSGGHLYSIQPVNKGQRVNYTKLHMCVCVCVCVYVCVCVCA